jgi:ribosomal protein S18 acetylase RimI-like enzyme
MPVAAGRRFHLQPARDADVPAIARLWADGWLDGHRGNVPEELHRYRTRHDFGRRASARVPDTTVAVRSGGVGALCGFVVVRGDEIEQLYVERACRGTPVAGSLLDHAEGLVSRRHRTGWLAVAPGNHRARRFYERHGWHDAGPFGNPAEIPGGVLSVPTRRYEKAVGGRRSADG